MGPKTAQDVPRRGPRRGPLDVQRPSHIYELGQGVFPESAEGPHRAKKLPEGPQRGFKGAPSICSGRCTSMGCEGGYNMDEGGSEEARNGPNLGPGKGPRRPPWMCNGRCTSLVWVGRRPRGHWGGLHRARNGPKTCPGGGPGGGPSMCNGRCTSMGQVGGSRKRPMTAMRALQWPVSTPSWRQ